jgi:methionyl-tRNA formyltransferase
MRTVLLTRGGADARHLASVLDGAGMLDAVVVEDSGAQRRGKLAKAFKGIRPWAVPMTALDVFVLVMYGNWAEKVLARGLAVPDFPAGVTRVDIGDANDAASIEALKELQPDVLIVLGTGILRGPVLAIPSLYCLNIHGGAVPEYRGVYSDFWTLANNDPGAVGSTIFHIDPGVDTGPVALTDRVQMQRWPTLTEIKIENSRVRARLMVTALRQACDRTLPCVPQRPEDARYWHTPSALQLARGLWRIRRSRLRVARSAPAPAQARSFTD